MLQAYMYQQDRSFFLLDHKLGTPGGAKAIVYASNSTERVPEHNFQSQVCPNM